MMEILSHRGADGHGHYINEVYSLALGHRRLKVIDLTDNGRQPMCDDSGKIWITYNGEIYNYRSLRLNLEKLGYNFRSKTDTEVIIYAYKEYGEKFINLLNGDFAFAIWDERTRDLLLYRDRVGIKPLYYAFQKNIFLFASEIKALLKHPLMSNPGINYEKIPEYFGHLYIYREKTLYRDIYEVQPGYCLKLNEGKLEKKCYYDFSFDLSVRKSSHEDQIQGFCELFEDSIKIRLESDVPLGVYLSGGIDSSYMTAILKEQSSTPVHTYSLGFDYEGFNEFPYSDYAARTTRTIHNKFEISERDFVDVIDKIIWHYDEPPPQIVAVPQYYLAREAKRHITVALTGSGGDELFAGYSHYQAAIERHRTNLAISGLSCSEPSKVEYYQRSLSPELIASEFKSCTQKHVVDKLFMDHIPDYRTNISMYFIENNYPDFLSKMLYMDFKTHVIAMMNKDDKMNMAWGIEGRYPFLDYRVIQHSLSMSPELKIRNQIGKWALKHLCKKYFNNRFINREKQAFPTPAEQWFASQDTGISALDIISFCGDIRFNNKNLRLLAVEPQKLCRTGVNARRIWGVYCLGRWMNLISEFNDRGSINELREYSVKIYR